MHAPRPQEHRAADADKQYGDHHDDDDVPRSFQPTVSKNCTSPTRPERRRPAFKAPEHTTACPHQDPVLARQAPQPQIWQTPGDSGHKRDLLPTPTPSGLETGATPTPPLPHRPAQHTSSPCPCRAVPYLIDLRTTSTPVAPPKPLRRSAPLDKVWTQVVAFSEIPPPTEWIFRAGVAYPLRAEILGYGPGAERHCVFSTGAFVEPIQIWDEPHRLKFSVTQNPAPMQEWTPYSHINPPHLHGFLVSNGGQFLLTPLPDGGTKLEGTTWYHHGLWPVTYWRWWSDAIIHRIHMRVLTHIRDEAERN